MSNRKRYAKGELRLPTDNSTKAARSALLVDDELMESLIQVRMWLHAAVVVTRDPDDLLSSHALFEALGDAVGRDEHEPELLYVCGLTRMQVTRVVTDKYRLCYHEKMTFPNVRGRRNGWCGVQLDEAAGNRAIRL